MLLDDPICDYDDTGRAGLHHYYIPAFYVPVLAVFQIMIFTYLLKGWTSNATETRPTRA